jgi:hypothetical protein
MPIAQAAAYVQDGTVAPGMDAGEVAVLGSVGMVAVTVDIEWIAGAVPHPQLRCGRLGSLRYAAA